MQAQAGSSVRGAVTTCRAVSSQEIPIGIQASKPAVILTVYHVSKHPNSKRAGSACSGGFCGISVLFEPMTTRATKTSRVRPGQDRSVPGSFHAQPQPPGRAGVV